jgi:hypothetical protein
VTTALSDALGIDVERADPFARVRLGNTGFEPADLPFLAPYMAAALGVALGQARPKDRRIDLTPVARRATRTLGPRRLLVTAGAVVLIGAAGALYVRTGSEISGEKDRLATANAQLADLQTQLAARVPVADGDVDVDVVRDATPAAVAASVAVTNVDWLAVENAVDADSAPLGVVISSIQGVIEPPSTVPAVPGAPGVVPHAGKLTLAVTAPGLPAVADWLDVVGADPRFAEPWASGFTVATQADGSTAVQFSVEMFVTAANLVSSDTSAEVVP